jgi:hypothetical protein
MSWDCPHWNNEICQLNGITCVPGKGQCVLKGRFEIKSGRTTKKNELNNNNLLTTKDTKSTKSTKKKK